MRRVRRELKQPSHSVEASELLQALGRALDLKLSTRRLRRSAQAQQDSQSRGIELIQSTGVEQPNLGLLGSQCALALRRDLRCKVVGHHRSQHNSHRFQPLRGALLALLRSARVLISPSMPRALISAENWLR